MPDARTVIRDRIATLQAIRANYLGYLKCRISESDWHGTWDAGVNISETECEIAGLEYALEAIEAEASSIPLAPGKACHVCGVEFGSFAQFQGHMCVKA